MKFTKCLTNTQRCEIFNQRGISCVYVSHISIYLSNIYTIQIEAFLKIQNIFSSIRYRGVYSFGNSSIIFNKRSISTVKRRNLCSRLYQKSFIKAFALFVCINQTCLYTLRLHTSHHGQFLRTNCPLWTGSHCRHTKLIQIFKSVLIDDITRLDLYAHHNTYQE